MLRFVDVEAFSLVLIWEVYSERIRKWIFLDLRLVREIIVGRTDCGTCRAAIKCRLYGAYLIYLHFKDYLKSQASSHVKGMFFNHLILLIKLTMTARFVNKNINIVYFFYHFLQKYKILLCMKLYEYDTIVRKLL